MTPAQRARGLLVLHRWNGWNLLVLLITGYLLFEPRLRAPLAPVRTALKHFHAVDGLLTVGLVLAYIPLLPHHWRKLGARIGQRLNVALVLLLMVGWTVSGVVVWAHRYVPPVWANTALLWHDLLTWYALPWVILHSALRLFQIRLPLPAAWVGQAAAVRTRSVNWGRRSALAAGAAAAGVAAWAVAGRRWGLDGFDSAVASAGDRLPGAARVAEAELVDPFAFDPPHPIPGLRPRAGAPGAAAAAPAPEAAPLAAGAGQDTPLYTADLVPLPSAVPLPGGGLRGRFRLYTVTGGYPRPDFDNWRFTVGGLVERPLTLNWKDFLDLPRTVQVSDFHCVTGWSVYHITWEGIRLSELMDYVGVGPETQYLVFGSGDGAYTDTLSVEQARMDDIMVAYLMDGKPIPGPQGGPVRLIVPQMYAYKSVKWLSSMTAQVNPHVGFWEERGYPEDAWIMGV